ncbi:Uncharacterized protein LOK49_LG15G01612 [Camellia lanceoleosa]|uniref:Uncharacterized protein n=1 Tax=Camellia lanceoleosa TaxID=1840588 RepID=A0ACC0F2V6_9ERIC|nr:Uncharacterized protein LOK49_LG15G01612 [Camellia lanceoleosa]
MGKKLIYDIGLLVNSSSSKPITEFLNGSLSLLSNSLLSEGSNGHLEGKSSEEEDHLQHSTKKVKETIVNDDDTMLDRPITKAQTELPKGKSVPADGKSRSTPFKSFKATLVDRCLNERPFDEDLDTLSMDNDFESEGKEIEEDEVPKIESQGMPRISLPKNLLAKIKKPWRNCLIIKLMGKKEDYTYVYTRGPWIVLDYYLIIRKWQPDLKPAATEEIQTTLWMRFPQLLIEYYNEKVLFHIAKTLGKPLKIDLNTVTTTRGKYARVCIEMDLKKPPISQFSIGKYNYNIEYEHLHMFCFNCDRVGHRKEWCSEKTLLSAPSPLTGEPSSQIITVSTIDRSKESPSLSALALSSEPLETLGEHFGPWMLMDKKGKKKVNKGYSNGPYPKSQWKGGQKPRLATSFNGNGFKASTFAQVTASQPQKESDDQFHPNTTKGHTKHGNPRDSLGNSIINASGNSVYISSNPFDSLQELDYSRDEDSFIATPTISKGVVGVLMPTTATAFGKSSSLSLEPGNLSPPSNVHRYPYLSPSETNGE